MADVSVRPARAGDAAAVADLQLRTWRSGYSSIVPMAALRAVTEAEAEARWLRAAQDPPTSRHHVLVALGGDVLVGFTAFGPPQDAEGADDAPEDAEAPEDAPEDAEEAPEDAPAEVTEIYALLVAPEYRRAGHGSRLLAAAVDHLRPEGTTTARTWVFDADTVTREFLAGAGWAPDGAQRALDMGEPVPQQRWHTDLTEHPAG